MKIQTPVFIDTETTGVRYDKDYVIEVAIIVTTPDFKRITDYSDLIHHMDPLFPQTLQITQGKYAEAAAVHKISQKEYNLNAKSPVKVLKNIEDLLHALPKPWALISDNPVFDFHMLRRLYEEYKRSWPFYYNTHSARTATLLAGIEPRKNPHRAGPDVENIYQDWKDAWAKIKGANEQD